METASPSPASGASPARAPEPFRFTGKATEYFGIWIVNLLLTIITLGIYSPWAKVRRLHYFYRHTELAGSTFDFHGRPIRILIGRVIAVAALVAYKVAVSLKSPLSIVIFVLLVAAAPWLLRLSLRFRLYNTSWRGTRFHFRGTLAAAYRVFLLNGFLTAITIYILAPFFHQRLKAYQHNNTWFGNTPFSFHARVGQFYRVYLLLLAAIVVFAIAAVGSGAGAVFTTMGHMPKSPSPAQAAALFKVLAVLYGVTILFSVSIFPTFTALITNLIWNNTRVGEHRIECRMAPLPMIWISITNLLAVVFTLGFMTPWAMVRWARYQVQSMQLIPAGDLQTFTTSDTENVGAVGEEVMSLFDFDISL